MHMDRYDLGVNSPDHVKIAKEVGHVAHALWEQVCSLEQDMLELGAQVQSCALQASDLQKRVAGIYQSLQGDAHGADPISQIQDLVKQGLHGLNELHEHLKSMQESLELSAENMRDLWRQCEKLNKSSRFFQVLALNMRIQAATVTGGAELFDTMVSSTKQLASDIAGVEDTVSALIRQSIDASEKAVELLHGQIPRISISKQRGVENLQVVSTRIQELRQGVSSGSLDLKDKSMKLSQGISGIVTSLQFQDRTRQRIEHLATSLKDCANLEPDVLSSLMLLSVAQIKDELFLIRGIEAQASRALGDMEQQLKGVISSLDSQKESGSTRIEWGPMLKELSSLVEMTIEQQKIGQTLEQEAKGGLERFEMSADNVQDQLKTIIAWKVKSKVLSLNSIILAGQLGESGVGLAVISQEIVRKSEELSEDVVHIGEKASLVYQEKQINKENTTSEVNGGELLEFIQKTAGEIETYKEQLKKGAFSGLLDEVRHSKNSLHAIEQMKKYFEKAVIQLEENFEKRFGCSMQDKQIPPDFAKNEFFMGIHNSYTMAEERKIFAICFGIQYTDTTTKASDESTGEIELF